MTLNYRLGAEGFLYLGDGNANRGLLDQIAALEWVRDNIAAFGGDPRQVTVFGESSGGMSIGTLLSMPRAEGLFRRAIIESGGAQYAISAAAAQRIRERLAEQLGLGVAATTEAFAAASPERFLAAQLDLRADLAAHPDPQRWGAEAVVSMMLWQPVIDGDVIPARPIERIAAGASANVDVLVGSNVDESRLFLVASGMIDQITDEALAGAVAAYGLPVEAAVATYRAAQRGTTPGELLAAIQSDWYFRIPTLRVAEAHTKHHAAATYVYEFTWRSPQLNGRLGACHGLEVAFVFNMLGSEEDPLLGAIPPQQLAEAMHHAWVAFATSGDPGWPRYEMQRRAAMRFDTTSAVVADPLARERVLWEGVR